MTDEEEVFTQITLLEGFNDFPKRGEKFVPEVEKGIYYEKDPELFQFDFDRKMRQVKMPFYEIKEGKLDPGVIKNSKFKMKIALQKVIKEEIENKITIESDRIREEVYHKYKEQLDLYENKE